MVCLFDLYHRIYNPLNNSRYIILSFATIFSLGIYIFCDRAATINGRMYEIEESVSTSLVSGITNDYVPLPEVEEVDITYPIDNTTLRILFWTRWLGGIFTLRLW